jgi:CubicO group peptidase (beta-lactamase class C family)
MELCDQIDQLLHSPTARPFNGAVLIAEGDEVIFEDAMGEKGLPHLNSQFLIGSISKQITAAMVLRHVQQGLVDLHTPIKAYLPDVHEQWGDKVALHQILNHTSGIKAVGEPLEFEPGAQFSYSNAAYDLAGKILENVAGTTYKTLIEKLFAEADMHNSISPEWETVTDRQYPQLVTGYVENERGEISPNKEQRTTASNPSGGLVSTVRDLLKWNLALHRGKILTPEMYQAMVTPSALREHRWGTVGYGYGVHLSGSEVHHNGLIPGYGSLLSFFLDNKISIIFLENCVLWTEKWDIKTQKAVFDLQDQIRDLVRNSKMFKS